MSKFLANLAAPLAHSFRMAANLVILKLIAITLGPVGMGVLGNFMSLTTMMSIFAGGGISSGITKYVAEYKSNPKRLIEFIGSALTFGTYFSIFIFIISIILSRQISSILFGSAEYYWLILAVGIFQIICFFGVAVVSVANGLRRQDVFAIITLVGYSLAIPIAWVLISNYKISGAAIALLVVASAAALPATYFAVKSPITKLFKFRLKRADAKQLARFSFMALASATIFPFAEIFIRTLIVDILGSNNAGYWQATIRLSGAYIGLFTLFMSISYMPMLSAEIRKEQVSKLIYKHLLGVGGVFAIFACILYFLKSELIVILFSPEFLPAAEVLGWYLVGDFFRVTAYVIGFLGVARAAWRLYVICEVLQVGLLILFTYVGLILGGNLMYVAYAYTIGYLTYFFVMLVVFRQYQKGTYDFFR
ncbi:O-antigen translocase [Limnohabitans sp. yimb22184]|uniref:O-antigen translocase n=1 Tax=Limnohabitans sp. YIMB22184 TaxID=3374104 RepID=UPI003A8927EA